MNIDLTAYVVNPWGEWFRSKENYTPCLLRLTAPDDGLTLVGPLRVRVSVQARNNFTLLGTSSLAVQAKDVFSYVLDIPPGQSWTYPSPAALSRQDAAGVTLAQSTPSDAGGLQLLRDAPAAAAAAPAAGNLTINTNLAAATVAETTRIIRWHPWLFGANGGYIVIIRPAGPDVCGDPCAPDPCKPDPCAPADPCAPRKRDCGCGCSSSSRCSCPDHAEEVPCDFAVTNRPNLGAFFPSACEPCAPGAAVAMPPVKGPPLIVSPAHGGTVRTRYFNGMFIAREDLETDWKNARIKRALMNRAMGQGVVWGLGICLDGDAICVMPGYGVDCCGNDIVISSAYRVETQALLRDPAAAAILRTKGPHRMHLALEYYECPEQPRPVHGDPCSPETTRCEMSRVRETARLRLVPPCDVSDAGPIKDFLNEIGKLKQDPVVGPLLKPDAIPAASPALGPAPAPQVPFTVLVEGLDQSGVVGTLSPALSPLLATDPVPNLVEGDAFAASEHIFSKVRVTLKAKVGFTFQTGTPVRTLPGGAPLSYTPSTSTISWEDDAPPVLSKPSSSSPPIAPEFTYRLQGWSMQDAAGDTFSAPETEIDLTNLTPGGWRGTPWGKAHANQVPSTSTRMVLHVEVQPTDVAVRRPKGPSPWPCGTEECDPEGRPLFSVTPPWLHEDPANPGQAADPKVLVLAVFYAWLASEMARNGPNTPAAVQRPQLEIATSLYKATWKAFYATVPDTEVYQYSDALQRLFQAWCRSFLYPGPKCECGGCGCEPHAVVIGCAMVDAGEIQMVDPWGGRRWVIHYPILSYWGQQFGIMPLDAIASRFFHLICCISGLPGPKGTANQISGSISRTPAGVVGSLGLEPTGRSSVVPLGASTLIVDRPSAIPGRLQELGVQPAAAIALNPIDFVTRVAEALKAGPAAAPGQALVDLTVVGMPEVHFITPGGAPAALAGGKLADFVRSNIESRSARSSVPPLLRGFAENVTQGLLAATPLQPAVDAERPVIARLSGARIRTVGDLVGANPEDLHAEVFGGSMGTALAGVVDAAEKTARSVAKAVGDAVLTFATERGVASRTELKAPALSAELAGQLTEKLAEAKLLVGADTVASVIETAASRRG